MRTPKRKAKLVDTAQLSFFDPDGALLDLRAKAQHLSTTLEHCAFLEEGRNRAEVAIAALEKDREPGAIAALEQNRDELTKLESQLAHLKQTHGKTWNHRALDSNDTIIPVTSAVSIRLTSLISPFVSKTDVENITFHTDINSAYQLA